MAHEINNPVGFVKSNLGTMNEYREDLIRLLDYYANLEATIDKESEISGNGAIHKAIEEIQKVKDEVDLDFILDDYEKVIAESLEGVARVAKIVSDLKDFSHVDKAELEHADINKGIESTINIVWNELKYKANVVKKLGDIPLIKCYPQRLNQVVMNILVNAAQAIEEKGEIRISTEADNGYVEIRISDTGSGMPPDVLSKIFDPFFTTKDVGKGTGLGLNMAYNIIQNHKGTIDVESEVGKGTTFIIRLPL
ncbi:MAG: ATP-binding protein [Deltaproteobacteria bacterium]|nr:ATP-binding protein [Deltaproteobacteria bacterium]